jgi:hypothetical protein
MYPAAVVVAALGAMWICCRHWRVWWRRRRREKEFFFGKKNQKTFAYLVRAVKQRAT